MSVAVQISMDMHSPLQTMWRNEGKKWKNIKISFYSEKIHLSTASTNMYLHDSLQHLFQLDAPSKNLNTIFRKFAYNQATKKFSFFNSTATPLQCFSSYLTFTKDILFSKYLNSLTVI